MKRLLLLAMVCLTLVSTAFAATPYDEDCHFVPTTAQYNASQDGTRKVTSTTLVIWLHDGGVFAGSADGNDGALNPVADKPWLDIMSLEYPLMHQGDLTNWYDGQAGALAGTASAISTKGTPTEYVWDVIDYELTNSPQYSKIYIGGYSAGAMIALEYAALYPETVEKVIALSAPTNLTTAISEHPDAWYVIQYAAMSAANPSTQAANLANQSAYNLITSDNDVNKFFIGYNNYDGLVSDTSQVFPMLTKFNTLGIKYDYYDANWSDSNGHVYFTDAEIAGGNTTHQQIQKRLLVFLGADNYDRAGLDISFDPYFYLDRNRDVLDVTGTDYTVDNAINHWTAAGKAEGRDPSAWFDMSFYIDPNGPNADLAGSYIGTDQGLGYDHWVSTGLADDARQSAAGFSIYSYATAWPDLVAMYGTNYAAIFAHHLRWGIYDGRLSNPYPLSNGMTY